MSLAGRMSGIRAGTPARVAAAQRPSTPVTATQNFMWGAPGLPMTSQWDADSAVNIGYYGYIYHYRCARKIAMTIAGLPFRAGKNPDSPGQWSALAPMAMKLGPAPGGPTQNISAKQLWTWSIVSYLITGRWGWETPTLQQSNVPTGLWPLVAARLFPILSDKRGEWFSGFQYQTNNGLTPLGVGDVFYAWRPSQNDWRQPESAMQAMALPSQIAVELDRFMRNFMRNSMVSPKMVVTPGFDDDDMRRSFQDQFLAEMTGVENAGRTAFAEYVDDSGENRTPNIQVVDLGTKPVDAQLIELQNWVRDVVCDGWGVPVSILGQAAERTYENADQEHRNYWTGPILETIGELQDLVNIGLAPRFGEDVGWFDLSKVAALKPAHRFTQITGKDAVDAELASVGEVREDWELPPEIPADASTETDPLPAVDDTPGASTGSTSGGAGRRADIEQFKDELEAFAAEIASENARAAAASVDPKSVLTYLADNYPPRVLGWVMQATWERRKVALDQIKLARRPGGRDFAKVDAITQAIKDGKELDPVVLVDTGEDKLEVADGYHRLLAYDRVGAETVDAYVGSGVGRHGPWESEMHDAKLNRAADDFDDDVCLTHGERAGACTGPGPCDTSPLGTGDNWVNKAGGLPAYIRAIAHALRRKGMSESAAIERAVGIIQNWARGGEGVTKATQARAAAALAEWEALKAKAHTQRDDGMLTETGPEGAGSLLPRPGPRAPHAPVRGNTRGKCGICGRSYSARIHTMPRPRRTRSYDPKEPRDPHSGKWSSLNSDFRKLADLAKAGGFSFNVGTGQPPTAGYMISYNGHTGLYEAHILNDPEHLKQAYKSWLRKHGSFLTADKYVGGWVESGKFWLEPSENELNFKTALQKGRDRDQISIYDVVNDAYHETGGSGGLGDKAPGDREAGVLPARPAQPADDDRLGARRVRRQGSGQPVRRGRSAGLAGLSEALDRARVRHAGPDGHSHVATGHHSGARKVAVNHADRQAAALEPAAEKIMRRVFAAQRKATTDRLTGNRGKAMLRAAQPPEDNPETQQPPPLVDAAQIFDLAHWVGATRDAVDPLYATIAATEQPRLKRFPATDMSRAAVQQALADRAGALADTVSRTTYDQIQTALAQGVANGDSMTELTAAINRIFDNADRDRAQMIARTEVIGALNTSADTHAQALGPDVVAGKEWAATHDNRTRATHRAADGQIQAITTPFLVGGFPMEHPGDPTAPPDEVINCRCTSLYLTPAEYARRTAPTAPPIAA